MAFHGGVSDRKRWSERWTTVKMSRCGAEQVLETRETRAQGWVAPSAAGVVGGLQAGAGGNAAFHSGYGRPGLAVELALPGPEQGVQVPLGQERPVSDQITMRPPLSHMLVARFCHGRWQMKERQASMGQKRGRGDMVGMSGKRKMIWFIVCSPSAPFFCPLSSFPYIFLLQRQCLSQCPCQLH